MAAAEVQVTVFPGLSDKENKVVIASEDLGRDLKKAIKTALVGS